MPPTDRIAARLAAIEAEHGVRIVFAAESGSRAWGFASADSDFDVRFIYCHPASWYLSLSERRDVIEYPLDADALDMAGWDLRKALRLLLRSNPPLHEWLVSPIIYRDDGTGAALRALFERHASPRRLMHHYLSMARGQRDLLGAREQVRRKRYLYVARPLLATRLLVRGVWPPPMTIDALLAAAGVPDRVARGLDALITEKREGVELGEGPRDPVLDDWVAAKLAEVEPGSVSDAARQGDGTPAAEAFFRHAIGLGDVPECF